MFTPTQGWGIGPDPEHFRVKEILRFPPSGRGDHLYLSIRKVGLGTLEVQNILAEKLRIPISSIGVTGLKDKNAVSEQWISILTPLDDLPSLPFEVLEKRRHTLKLKTQVLEGNSFEITLLPFQKGATLSPIEEVVETVEKVLKGFPNFFGPQRFGNAEDNHLQGKHLLKQKLHAAPALKKLWLNAYQSYLFHLYLIERQAIQPVGEPLEGEPLKKGLPSGPLWGYESRLPTGRALELEQTILQRESVNLRDFKKHKITGTRRPLVCIPTHTQIQVDSQAIRVSFTLPPGSFATVALGFATGEFFPLRWENETLQTRASLFRDLHYRMFFSPSSRA